MPKKRLQGEVVSNKMQKTIVVEVKRTKKHPLYKKRYEVKKTYKAHDEQEQYKLGDRVVIEETRPISKDKKWKVIKSVSSNNK